MVNAVQTSLLCFEATGYDTGIRATLLNAMNSMLLDRVTMIQALASFQLEKRCPTESSTWAGMRESGGSWKLVTSVVHWRELFNEKRDRIINFTVTAIKNGMGRHVCAIAIKCKLLVKRDGGIKSNALRVTRQYQYLNARTRIRERT